MSATTVARRDTSPTSALTGNLVVEEAVMALVVAGAEVTDVPFILEQELCCKCLVEV